MQLRAQVEAARVIKEEPERFFLPTKAGILEPHEYNKIIGIAEDYKPKLTDEVPWYLPRIPGYK